MVASIRWCRADPRHRTTTLLNAPRTLAATRLTPDIQTGCQTLVGQARSVYRAALYVDVRDTDELIVVAIDEVGGVPGGINVRGTTDLRLTGIRSGMTFRATSDGWSIPAAGVAIDRSRAVVWSPALPPAAMLPVTPDLVSAAAAARRLAADRAPGGGLGPLLSETGGGGDLWLARARALIRTQLAAFRTGRVADAIGPSVELIGLGVGLTPSGDDYLVGLLAGLEATGEVAGRVLAATVTAHAPGRTTAIAAAALAHAARGAFAERVHDLLAALAAGGRDRLETSIERATAYGATSGSDTLVGLFGAVDLALERAGLASAA